MKFNALVDTLFSMYLAGSRQTVLLLGPPGIGKSAVASALAGRITAHHQQLDAAAPAAGDWRKDLSSALPEDLNGLPKTDGEVMRFVPDTWLADACTKGRYGVLTLDDLPAASKSVQVATRQLVLDRRIHEHILSDDVFIIVTGNRRDDKAAATALPSHFLNSVVMLTLDEDFAEWVKFQRPSSTLAGFLAFRPKFFSQLPKDADRQGAFATPRSWSRLDNLLKATKWSDEQQLAFSTGMVGEGVAVELAAFARLAGQLPPAKDLYERPEAVLPPDHAVWQQPDIRFAVLAAMAAGMPERKTAKVAARFLTSLCFVCREAQDFAQVGLMFYELEGGNPLALVNAAATSDAPAVKAIRKHYAESF